MKKVFAFIFLALLSNCAAQGQTGAIKSAGEQNQAANQTENSPELAEAARLNSSVVKLFGEGKFEEALPLATQVLEIRERALGGAHTLVASALMNLAAVHQRLQHPDDARKLYKRALSIYEKNGQGETVNAINTRHTLALMEDTLAGAISLHERNLAAKEKVSGPDSMEVSLTLFPLAHLYEMQGDFDKAEKLFGRFISIREKLNAGAQDDRAVAYLRVGCVLRKEHKAEEAQNAEARAKEIFSAAAEKLDPILEGGIINGKAISKPAPIYPVEAKQTHAEGTILVHLLVGETGTVLAACAEDKGNKYLKQASEAAAYGARFTATTISGKHVKVMGVITYKFVLQ